MQEKESHTYKIMVYGAEEKGIVVPSQSLKWSNYELSFKPYNTESTFDEFDGVITFQGLFEEIHKNPSTYRYSSEYDQKVDRDQLDKRFKELELLLSKGGFICFVLCQFFLGQEYPKLRSGDLVKNMLNIFRLDRINYSTSIPYVDAVRSEFKSFIDRYGRAWSSFRRRHNCDCTLRELATSGSDTVGMIIGDTFFFVPARFPEPNEVESYFKALTTAVISTRKKLLYTVPDWVNEFRFSEETDLIKQKSKLEEQVVHLNKELEVLERYKRILILSGELLVEEIIEVLEKGFGFKVDPTDEYKEDIKILNDRGEPIVLVEIKGVNEDVRNAYINQVDTHREQKHFSSDFPAVLIANTRIKSAQTITYKDQEIHKNAITHAVKMNVLILRTLDLLRLLKSLFDNKIKKEEVLEIFMTKSGWLRVSEDSFTLIHGNESSVK